MKKFMAVFCLCGVLVCLGSCSDTKKAKYDMGGGDLNSQYEEDASFEDMISSVPTKDGYVFAGWYSDASYTDYIDPKNITKVQKEQKRAFAKWIVVEDVSYVVRDSEVTISDCGRKNQTMDEISISGDFNPVDLKRAGYRSLKLKVTMEASEKNDGYQYVFVYKDKNCLDNDFSINDVFNDYVLGEDNEDPSELYAYKHDHGGDTMDTSWRELNFVATISLESISENLYL